MQLTPEQRVRVIAELMRRSKLVEESAGKALSDEELMLIVQRGHALSMEIDPTYAALYPEKKKKKKI
ncbi:MAG TPA: hypothetical protein VJY15_02435 [Candidatus Acidoferrum sp.]|nr:hypothetical protein [Candidatus Acidoferrum sp.]